MYLYTCTSCVYVWIPACTCVYLNVLVCMCVDVGKRSGSHNANTNEKVFSKTNDMNAQFFYICFLQFAPCISKQSHFLVLILNTIGENTRDFSRSAAIKSPKVEIIKKTNLK